MAPLFRFNDEHEAVALANATEFGLAAYVYTRDLARAWRVSEAIESGMVGLNTGLISTEVAPFGGIKESGIGRAKARSTEYWITPSSSTSASAVFPDRAVPIP